MGFVDKAKAAAEGARVKAEEIVGEVKESFGEAYGNEALEVDGELEADAAREREAELDAEDGPREGA
ncbi:MAG: CsbD family protein [Geodermatophilaceae bacterium]|jgi:uncharacterized protein YjbJ (UPF0337 family)|nr:CsbD family protein [Geodermatophilaceae bacterium]MDQ3454327.1 CsbD family protein [Actinomycetota bacterium]